MSETCRGHLWEKIIVKLFASSWYIFLTHKGKVWKCVVWNHVAGTGAERLANRGPIPCMGKKFYIFWNVPERSRTAWSTPYWMGFGRYFSGDTANGAWGWPLTSSAEVMNDSNYMSTPQCAFMECRKFIVLPLPCPLVVGQARQCCQPMAPLHKLERATWALALLQQKTLDSIGRDTNHIQHSHSGKKFNP